jgi:hypothetical protein
VVHEVEVRDDEERDGEVVMGSVLLDVPERIDRGH